MRMIDPFLQELEQESATTRKFLESMPADNLGWKPHPKSMSAGQLATHIATLTGQMSEMAALDTFDMTGSPEDSPKTLDSKDEILKAFEANLEKTRTIFNSLDDAKLAATWTFKINGHEVMSMPRIAVIRGWIMNHLYHHRGQFGVYLRLLGARVPASYGPSGDENPMAEVMEKAAAR